MLVENDKNIDNSKKYGKALIDILLSDKDFKDEISATY